MLGRLAIELQRFETESAIVVGRVRISTLGEAFDEAAICLLTCAEVTGFKTVLPIDEECFSIRESRR